MGLCRNDLNPSLAGFMARRSTSPQRPESRPPEGCSASVQPNQVRRAPLLSPLAEKGGAGVVPSMGMERRRKSSGKLIAATHMNRKATSRVTGPAVRLALKEAGSELAGRRTETTSEAAKTRASGLLSAKLSRSRVEPYMWRSCEEIP